MTPFITDPEEEGIESNEEEEFDTEFGDTKSAADRRREQRLLGDAYLTGMASGVILVIVVLAFAVVMTQL